MAKKQIKTGTINLDFPNLAEGKKYDQGKTRWDLVPWEAVEPLAEVLTFGANKYGDNSWQLVDNAVERYKAALFRHLVAWCKGEKKDPESGKSHLHHALCNVVFLIWFELHGYYQQSGWKDDEKYMTTEQMGKINREISENAKKLGELPPVPTTLVSSPFPKVRAKKERVLFPVDASTLDLHQRVELCSNCKRQNHLDDPCTAMVYVDKDDSNSMFCPDRIKKS